MNRSIAQRVLVSAIMSCGLSTAAWAQMHDDTRQADRTDTTVEPRGQRPTDRDGWRDQRPHMQLLRETYGATLRPLQREMAASHDLKPGVGLVVEEVKPSSVAANGGLQKGDIIFKVGDQWAINPEQFATLLTVQDADNGFEVKVYRGTERVDLNYKFDQAALDTMNRSLETAMGAPDQRTDRTMDRGDHGGMDRDNAAMDRNNPMIIPEKFDYKDDLNSIAIRTEDGVKKLLVKDKDGSVLFDGPYNTAAERDAVPAEIRAKVERVLREKVK